MRWVLRLFVTICIIAYATAPHAGQAKSPSTVRTIGKTFQVPPSLKVPVDFWRDIYAKYDRDHIVIHDTEHLDIVYDVVDVTDLSKRTDLSVSDVEEMRRARVREAKERVRSALSHLNDLCQPPGSRAKKKKPPRAAATVCSTDELLRQQISSLEKKVVNLFSKIGGPEKFKEAMSDDRLRSQTGQRDKFMAGVKVSGRYMQMIEKIFKENGIPWEISRLVFVESMFNLKAYSKAGASGIWQFMPGTARIHGLLRDSLVDERNDPVAATQAAARLLKTDYSVLGAWPLAINAYNSGRGRLVQAVARLGTKDIGRIIHEFDHSGYGFASRNFYPEFLAALDVYEHHAQHFGEVEIDPSLEFEAVVTTAPVPLPDIARAANVPLQALQELNPAYVEEVFSGVMALPAGYTVKVPPQKGAQFLAAIDKISRELSRHGFYVVQKGETLPAVATKTGVAAEQLRQLNGLRGAALVPGQILRLPLRSKN